MKSWVQSDLHSEFQNSLGYLLHSEILSQNAKQNEDRVKSHTHWAALQQVPGTDMNVIKKTCFLPQPVEMDFQTKRELSVLCSFSRVKATSSLSWMPRASQSWGERKYPCRCLTGSMAPLCLSDGRGARKARIGLRWAHSEEKRKWWISLKSCCSLDLTLTPKDS